MYKGIHRIGELSQDGVFIYDLDDSRFEYINDAFAIIFKTDRDRLMKNAGLVLPFIRSEDTFHLKHCVHQLRQSRRITNGELRLQYDDGTVKHLWFDAFLIDDPKLVAGFVKDYTKEKEHEDYIINYGARKDTLLDMTAHNLSGPLHLSQNLLRWMQDTHRLAVPEEIISQLQMIQDNTQHCLDIINDLLKEEHLESERIFVKKTRFDVLDKITATLDKMIASNKDKQFRLITDLENLNISTDSVKFFQIIHNLVSNAIKFTPAHGQIDILVEETKSTFIIRVRDNGIGIPAEMHGSLFQRKTPAGRSGLNQELSTGIGLSIVKRLVELLDGKIWFESEENKGSTFSIEFPKD